MSDGPDHDSERETVRDGSGADGSDSEGAELPESVVEEVTRLTRLARRAHDDGEAAAYRDRRDELLAEYGFTARVRKDDGEDVLVCHPAEWIEDGTVVLDRVEDVERGVERPLSGAGSERSWEAVESRNDDIVAEIADATDPVHTENARALATFANNHYAKPIPELTAAELREFRAEYFPRNAFPTDEQRDVLEKSLGLVYDRLDLPMPEDSP